MMAKEKQKKPEEKKVEVPACWSVAVTCMMEFNAKKWEEGIIGQTPRETCAPNPRMAECIREDIKYIEKKRHEFKLENGLIEPEKPKAKKKKVREYNGDTDPKLIEQAIKAMAPGYPSDVDEDGNEVWDDPLVPTSVELLDDSARIWYEFDETVDEDGNHVSEFEFSLVVPIYHFWGRKKRDKYLKEQKIERQNLQIKKKVNVKATLNDPKYGEFKSIDFEDQNIIIMPAGVDQTRLIKHGNSSKSKIDRSYVGYSGSRYGEDRATHAHVFNTKEGRDFIWKTLVRWYGGT